MLCACLLLHSLHSSPSVGFVAINRCQRVFSADKAPVPGMILTALDSENLPDARQPGEHRGTPSRQSDNLVPIGVQSDDLADDLTSTGPKCAECQHGATICSRLSKKLCNSAHPVFTIRLATVCNFEQIGWQHRSTVLAMEGTISILRPKPDRRRVPREENCDRYPVQSSTSMAGTASEPADNGDLRINNSLLSVVLRD